MTHVRTYNPSVRVGNWNEDIQLEEDTLKNFLEKRDNGELLIQKKFNLSAAMGKPMQTSISQDYCVHIGDHVMIKCAAAADQTQHFKDIPPRQACIVALNLDDPTKLMEKKIMSSAQTSGCMTIEPNQRTLFCIESVDGGLNGSKLRYGQPFRFVTIGENTGKLYLCSDKVNFNKCAKKSRHQELFLVSDPNFLTQWTVQHRNPLRRLEYEYEPVEANQELIIFHSKTNRCLAVEQEYITRTPFGREYELSTNTYLDSHKAEEDRNRWMLVMGVPGSYVRPVPEQGPAPAPLHPKE